MEELRTLVEGPFPITQTSEELYKIRRLLWKLEHTLKNERDLNELADIKEHIGEVVDKAEKYDKHYREGIICLKMLGFVCLNAVIFGALYLF